MKVYLLWHVHDLEGEEDVKLLGVYWSEQKAEEAKKRSIKLPGFREMPEGFRMDCYEVDQDHWTEGFITVT